MNIFANYLQGHTCNIWDGQMIVVGGYIGQDISCESPGVYVFNTSSLQWVNSYTSLTANDPKNPLSQQENQIGAGIRAGIEGSYDFKVPQLVYDSIGGNSTGGATYAGPVMTATAGPMKTGTPIVYTITATNGAAATGIPNAPIIGQHPTSTSGSKVNVGATVAGVIAGLLFLLACYLAFCAYLYRKQLKLYKRHAAVDEGSVPPYTQRASAGFFGGIRRGSWKEATEGGSRSSGVVSPVPNGKQNRVSDSVVGAVSRYSASGANSHEDLMDGMEPNYWGVLLHPRRSLRVINR
jgi:hypothetical protein